MVLVWHHSTLEVKVSCVRWALKTIAACLSAGIKGLRHPLPEAAFSQNSKVFLPSLRIVLRSLSSLGSQPGPHCD